MDEAGLVGSVPVSVLQTEGAVAVSTEPGQQVAARTAHPAREGRHRDADAVRLGGIAGGADVLERRGAEMPHVRPDKLAHALEEAGLGEVAHVGVPVVPVLQALDDDAEMRDLPSPASSSACASLSGRTCGISAPRRSRTSAPPAIPPRRTASASRWRPSRAGCAARAATCWPGSVLTATAPSVWRTETGTDPTRPASSIPSVPAFYPAPAQGSRQPLSPRVS